MPGVIAACSVLSTLALWPPAHADVSGRASVIDGDTIGVSGDRVRLHGTDGPESPPTCLAGNEPWGCAAGARLTHSATGSPTRPLPVRKKIGIVMGTQWHYAASAPATSTRGWCRRDGRSRTGNTPGSMWPRRLQRKRRGNRPPRHLAVDHTAEAADLVGTQFVRPCCRYLLKLSATGY